MLKSTILILVVATQLSSPCSVNPSGEVTFEEDSRTRTLTVTAQDGTKYVYDLQMRKQYIVVNGVKVAQRRLK